MIEISSSKGPNRVGVFHLPLPHLRTETDPVSETFCFQVSRIPDHGQSPKTQEFCSTVFIAGWGGTE
jgi:hypothetical protein